jgi:hypothetical protein
MVEITCKDCDRKAVPVESGWLCLQIDEDVRHPINGWRFEDIPQHVYDIAEHSEIVSLMGLPWDTWVVREFLPTMPFGICPRYGNMPVCREFRYFIEDERYCCSHPYWPMEAIEQQDAVL